MKRTNAICLAALLALSAVSAQAGGDSSDGHTHAPPTPLMATALTPRADAVSEEFEVVIVPEGKTLVLTVDRFESNEPVAKARVDVEGAGLKVVASETAPGTYVVALATPLPPAIHPLTITIEAGDTVDLLSATLDTSMAAKDVAHVHDTKERLIWGTAGVLLLTAGVLIMLRRRRKGFGHA